MPERSFAALSDEQFADMLTLVDASDSVELKLTIPEFDNYETIGALGMDALDAQIRQVFFFDTPELALNDRGLVARARRVQGKGDDSVVKLRPVRPAELPDKLRRSPSFNVEVDAAPDGYVCSGSLKATLETGLVKKTLDGNGRIRKLFTKEQRAFFRDHAPDGVGFDDLVVLGPVFVLKLKFRPDELGRKAVAEMWFYPDFSRILELSTRCAPAKALEAAAQARTYLTDKNVYLSGEQAAKTRTTLQFFSDRLGVRA
jgi:hypothetical protein